MLNIVLAAVLAVIFVMDVILFVRDVRHRRALLARTKLIDESIQANAVAIKNILALQALITQYQQTMESIGKQLQDAGVGIQTRDQSILRIAAALQDIHQVIHHCYELFVSDEDKEILNDAWRGWHARNVANLQGHPGIVA